MSAANTYSNPFMGALSYKATQENSFFGRDKEAGEIISLIKNNQLTIIFGASGTGKSSLINAKLYPQLKREYHHPIHIKINFANDDLLAITKKKIVQELRQWEPGLPDFKPGQTLIDFAATNGIFEGLIKPVLFFDQFEELFTLGPMNEQERINEFINELSDLIELRLPDELKNFDNINNLLRFKIVISLRQDWIAYLEDYSHLIPSIYKNRYRVKRFAASQALEAIMLPTDKKISIEITKKIIRTIGEPALVEEVDKSGTGLLTDIKHLMIDPFVLSIYCYELLEKVNGDPEAITATIVSENDPKILIRTYYERKMKGWEHIKVHIEKMITESGRRIPVRMQEFKNAGEEQAIVEIANSSGILKLSGNGEKQDVEIVHDLIANQILESKKERSTKEAMLKSEQKVREAEQLKRSARKRAVFVGAVPFVLLCVVVYFAFKFMQTQERFAKEAEENANVRSLQAKLAAEKKITEQKNDSLTILKNDLALQLTLRSAKNKVLTNQVTELAQTTESQNNRIQHQRDSLVGALKSMEKQYKSIITSIETNHKDEAHKYDSLLANNKALKSDAMPPPMATVNLNITDLEFKPGYFFAQQRPDSSYKISDIMKDGIRLRFKLDYNQSAVPKNEKVSITVSYPTKTKTLPFSQALSIDKSIKNISIFTYYDKLVKGTCRFVVSYKGKTLESGHFEIY